MRSLENQHCTSRASLLQTECDRLRDEYEKQIGELEREIERTHREKRLVLEEREEHTELVNCTPVWSDLSITNNLPERLLFTIRQF